MALLGWTLLLSLVTSLVANSRPPNMVLFMADDVGMGDLGCFGNRTLKTPNIDSIARQGATLTHHIAAASVCTPSRAAFLTGRYPIRMGMVPTNIVRVNMFAAAVSGLPSEEVTMAEMVKKKGYKSALIGKWHLGLHSSNSKDYKHHPMSQGFDHFYGLPLTNLKDFGDDGESVVTTRIPYMDPLLAAITCGGLFVLLFLKNTGHDGRILMTLVLLSIVGPPFFFVFYRNLKIMNSILMRGHDVVEQPIRLYENLTQKFTQEGLEFLEARAGDEAPFLLLMPWVQVHTALHTSREFRGRSKHGAFGDNVEELDWSVGEILNALDRLNMKTNTFVYFSSDNGAHDDERNLRGDVCGGYNGVYKGGKSQGGMEGGIRVPTLAMMPGVIPAGSVVAMPTSNMDVMPTVAELSGAPLPSDRIIDGRSMMPLLSGKTRDATHEMLFHYCGEDIHAARYAPPGTDDVWKVHFATPKWVPGTEGCGYICDCYGNAVTWHEPPLMYNIAKDAMERRPLNASEPQFAAILERIRHAQRQHSGSINRNVEDQFSVLNLLPRPWLQPCCNFPYCNCVDEKYQPKPKGRS